MRRYTGTGPTRSHLGDKNNEKHAVIASSNDSTDSDVSVERIGLHWPLCSGNIVAFESVSSDGRWMWSIGTILVVKSVDGFSGRGDEDHTGLAVLAPWKVTANLRGSTQLRERKFRRLKREEDATNEIRRRQEELRKEKAALSRELYIEEVVRTESLADAAREALRRIGSNHWNEFCAIRRPLPVVRLAVQAVMMMLRVELLAETEEEEWDRMLRFLRSEAFTSILASESSLSIMDALQADMITENFLEHPLFVFERAMAASRVAGLMQKWVTTELLLHHARSALQSIDERLAELNREVEQTDLERRWHENCITRMQEGGASDGDDDSEAVQAALECMATVGKIAFMRSDETSVVLRSAVFCRIIVVPPLNGGAPQNMTISRHGLARIRAAAFHRNVDLTTQTPQETVALSRKKTFTSDGTEVPRLLDAASQVEILCEETYRREHLMVRELESRYERHILYVAEQQKLHEGLTQTQQASRVHGQRQLAESEKKWSEAEKKKQAHLFQQQQKETVLNMLSMEQVCHAREEQWGRSRLALDEAQHWSKILLTERRNAMDLQLLSTNHHHAEVITALRTDLVARDRSRWRAAALIADYRASTTLSPPCTAQLARVEAILREPRPSFSSPSSPPFAPVSSPAPSAVSDREETALRRALEDERARRAELEGALQRQKDALAQAEAQRAALEAHTRELHDQLAFLEDAPTRSSSSGFVRTPPGSARGSERREMDAVLREIGAAPADAPVAEKAQLLRAHLAQQRAALEGLRAERDAQAADARMLESYLRTAADALENALLHDERWRPRTTEADFTSWHWRAFPGTGWGRVVEATPEALRRALVHDIAAACHLPDEYVRGLRYRDDGHELQVSFDLRHDPAIPVEELKQRLGECNFYEIDKLYAQHVPPEDGVDALQRKLLSRETELKELRSTIARLRRGERSPAFTHSINSSVASGMRQITTSEPSVIEI